MSDYRNILVTEPPWAIVDILKSINDEFASWIDGLNQTYYKDIFTRAEVSMEFEGNKAFEITVRFTIDKSNEKVIADPKEIHRARLWHEREYKSVLLIDIPKNLKGLE